MASSRRTQPENGSPHKLDHPGPNSRRRWTTGSRRSERCHLLRRYSRTTRHKRPHSREVCKVITAFEAEPTVAALNRIN